MSTAIDSGDRVRELFRELSALSADAADDPAPEVLARRAAVRDRLIREHAPMARNVARRYASRGEPMADLEQVAMLGLIHAVDRYDPCRGDFLPFAVPTITGELRRHFRDHGWGARVPRRLKDLHVALGAATSELSQQLGRAPTARELSARTGTPLDAVIESMLASNSYRSRSLDGMPDGDGDVALATSTPAAADRATDVVVDLTALAPAVAALPPRDRAILAMRFYEDLTQTQIAQRLGISQMHVSRLLGRTLTTLREHLDVP